MTTDPRNWLDGLRAFAATHREQKPVAAIDASHPAHSAERAILAADLTTRLATLGDLFAARATAARATGQCVVVRPAVVVTTSPVGIAVVADLLTSPTRPLQPLAAVTTAVTELEYRLWCIRHPDDGSRLHLNLWSWVKTSVPERRWHEFARHPLGPGEAYWLHRTGVSGAGSADARHCHLWKWNGRHAALLQAFVREHSVSHLDAPSDRDGADTGGRD